MHCYSEAHNSLESCECAICLDCFCFSAPELWFCSHLCSVKWLLRDILVVMKTFRHILMIQDIKTCGCMWNLAVTCNGSCIDFFPFSSSRSQSASILWACCWWRATVLVWGQLSALWWLLPPQGFPWGWDGMKTFFFSLLFCTVMLLSLKRIEPKSGIMMIKENRKPWKMSQRVSLFRNVRKNRVLNVSLLIVCACRQPRRRPQGGLHGGPVAPKRGRCWETSLGLHFYSRPLRGQGREIGVREKPCPSKIQMASRKSAGLRSDTFSASRPALTFTVYIFSSSFSIAQNTS